MGGLNSKQIADIKKGKTDVLVITNQRKETLQKKLYTLTSTKTWNLSNNFLTNISSKISALTLTTIDLSSNDFPIFPAELCKIATLTTLNLSYNFITDIPADVQHLTSLTELNLSFNRISDIQELGKIVHLQVLKITNNYISKIPDSFSKLQHINHLSLSHNSISSLPKYTWLTIESFHISSNLITHVPFAFLSQIRLRVLSLSRNKITIFPSPQPIPGGITSNLREIFINNNHLTELHTNIYHFPKLEVLDLKANELREIPFELFVHSPLIRSLDLSFNPGCKWGMHMPNTFAPPPLIRDIHLSKKQCTEIGRSFLGNVYSDSDNTDSESSSSSAPRGRKIAPSSPSRTAISLAPASTSPTPSRANLSQSSPAPRTAFTQSPSASPASSPSSSPSSSPATNRRSPLGSAEAEGATSTTTTIATSTARMTTTIITADASDTQIIAPSRRSQLGRLGPDEQKDLKRKASSRHVKKYVHNKKQFRLVEHDHSIWEQAVASHASHLAELLVWSGDPCSNVEDEIKKILLQMTQIRPGLFLSSKYAAQDRDTLHANNITHILIVGAELHPAFPSEFEYYTVSVRDNAIVDDLSIYFPVCQKFIDTGRKKGGVLVHCAAGSSRSASCIMAYLMWKENISFNDVRKELKALRPIVKTNFYLQLEFYEGVLRGQTKRKLKSPEQQNEKPKLVRSTSLPTIDALHAFKIENSLEKESEREQEAKELEAESAVLAEAKQVPMTSASALQLRSPHLSLDIPRPPSRTETMPSIIIPKSPREIPMSPTSITPRNMRRASRSLYSDLRVSLPKSDSQPALDVISESTSVVKEEKVEKEAKEAKEPEEAALTVVIGGGADESPFARALQLAAVAESDKSGDAEDLGAESEELGEGVPPSVIRQASDFEDLSEIHQLMRVHSLPELVADGKQMTRKLSRGKSFLKNSRINLLEAIEEEHEHV